MTINHFLHCCGGRTRTCDLQVMSLASYQLLHTAILTNSFLNCECKGTTIFRNHQIFSTKSNIFNSILTKRGHFAVNK